MLSKIVKSENAQQLVYEKFSFPTIEEIDVIVAQQKREAKRRKIVEGTQDDPLQEARKEANRILVEAEQKLKDAQLEAEAMKARKEREIRAHMEQEFAARVDAEVKNLKHNFLESLETVGKMKKVVFKQSEKEMTELVYSIARKVIGDEVQTTPEIVLSMLQKGFERISEAQQFEIKLHPVDYDLLIQEKESLKEILQTSGTIKFTKDESVERGGCRIVTESGEISSEPGKQLDIILKELEDGT